MQENKYYKSLIVWPNNDLRQEGFIEKTIFGEDSETPISAIVKELHLHTQGKGVKVAVDNPVQGGPIVAVVKGKEKVLIPGESYEFDTSNITFLAKKGNCIQILILKES